MSPKELLLAFATGILPVAAALPSAADAQTAAAAPIEDVRPLGPVDCNPVMFRILPGAFNFCVALKQWNRGDHEDAVEFMELAAAWGNKSAQMALGVAYYNGDGAPRDRALGLAWLALAAERKEPKAAGLYLSALSRASASERQRADRLYRQMRVKYADNVAAARADRRYRRELRALRANPAYGIGTCIAGLNARVFSNPDVNVDMSQACSMASEDAVVKQLERRYEAYFRGWRGRATVGPLEPLEPPGGR